jgi:hypothetical protein
MSMSKIQSRSEILIYIARGKSEMWIAPETQRGRDLMRKVHRALNFPSLLFALKHSFGSSRKVNNDLI